jgi:hypothetical protein
MFWYPKYIAPIITWGSGELTYEVSCDNYFDELKKLPITMTEVDFDDYGFDNNMSEVHKSDFLRLHLMATYGGVWSDMDIFYFKPITNLAVNNIQNKDKETFVCYCYYKHSIGFFMGTPGNAFYKTMRSHSIKESKEYYPMGSPFQHMASDLWNKHFHILETIDNISPVANIDMDAVYSIDASDIPAIYDGSPPRFTSKSIGIHWYAGHPLSGKFLQETNGGLTNLPDNVLGNLLKNQKYGI